MSGIRGVMGYRKNWGPPGAARLTCRESQVLELVAEGKRNHEIGECLGISPQTVKIHLSNVYEKFGVNRRIEAASALLSQSSYPRTKAS